MLDIKGKTREESKSTMTELVLPNDANLLGNLLGGKLLHWIDIAGALTATRHYGGVTATVMMDAIEFRQPIPLGSIVTLTSYVTWTGNTSLEVAVEVYSENTFRCDNNCEKKFINKVYLVFVGFDKDSSKLPVPPLITVSESEQLEFQEGFQRRKKRIINSHRLDNELNNH